MDLFTVSFFGHREVNNAALIENELFALISSILKTNDYVEFLVGRDGNFDLITASVICQAKKTIRADNSSMIWVLPYSTAEYLKNQEYYHNYYDDIEICENSSLVYYKAAFQNRNRYMVDRSNLIITYIEHKYGGAYQTLKYAKAINKPVINIYDEIKYKG